MRHTKFKNGVSLIHIKISDTGWILEKLAREITTRLPYVTYDTGTNPEAEIQYYLTYGCRERRVSPIEIALFTHKEEVPAAAEKFEKVASEVDFCVAQSPATEAILKAHQISNVRTICPGVDLDRFAPKLRIGVVGRTYHTGRKGEALVAAVMDIPGIEWHFTGEGWPGPAEFIADEDMPAFYRSLDYVLVPALIEGGPMCVLEALASGCQVIGAPVGWVPLFPHIPFKLGDADDLRRVLLDLQKIKTDMRASVETFTWDAWAQQHHALFAELLGHDPLKKVTASRTVSLPGREDTALTAALIVHGDEMTGAKGGPSVRAPRTATSLRRLGVAADFHTSRAFAASDYDVAHVFNLWPPKSCDNVLQQIEKAGTTSVLSPIFLDLTELSSFQGKVSEILRSSESTEGVQAGLAELRLELDRQRQTLLEALEPTPGYFPKVRTMVAHADHLILLSEHEKRLLKSISADHPSISIVKNPVDTNVFAGGDPTLFRDMFGVEDYVLCVGRIESRKNQALLAFALRETDIPLVLIGHESSKAYGDLVRKWGNRIVFADRLEPGSAMLASALAGARVFCLPSWSEGASLAALEAAAAGCSMVLSNRSSEEEYFGDLARYVNPADPNDIKDKVLAAYGDANWNKRKQQLAKLIRTEHSWEKYAKATADAYLIARMRRDARIAQQRVPAAETEIYIDLTTLAHHDGPPTGIARVEDRLAHELGLSGAAIRYVLWNSAFRKFIEIFPAQIESGEIKHLRGPQAQSLLLNPNDSTPYAEIDVTPGSKFVIFGGAWIRNTAYLQSLRALKQAKHISLISMIYDVIQYNHSTLFPAGVGKEFGVNCSALIAMTDQILTCSQRSRADIEEMCILEQVPCPPIDVIRLGDEAKSLDPLAELQQEEVADLAQGKKFILYVSSIDARKNHSLLFGLWQKLIKEFGEAIPTLVLVGRIGWRGDEIIEVLSADKALQERVVIRHGINDKTLEWFYKNCLFTVYPSLYEGWGLPVAESLRHEKFCIASDGGSLPEVGPNFVELINPLDFNGWYRALKHYIFSPINLRQKTEKTRSYKPTEWAEVARNVEKAIQRSLITPALEVLVVGQRLSFCDQNSGATLPTNYLQGGWGRSEPNGTWTVGTTSTFSARLDRIPKQEIALEVAGFGFAAEHEPVQVAVLANGTTVARWFFGPASERLYARIPSDLIPEGIVRIEFHIMNPRTPASLGSTDARLLGFKAESLTLCNPMEIAPGSWHDLGPLTAPEFILRRPATQGANFLGMEIAFNQSGTIQIRIDGKVVSSIVVRAGENAIHGIDLLAFVPDGRDVFGVSFVVMNANAPLQISTSRIGFFETLPMEVLRRAVRPTRTARQGNGHVPYAGRAPTLASGVTTLVNNLVHGLAGGWHAAEAHGAWTNGDPASIYLQPRMADAQKGSVTLGYLPFEPLRQSGARFEIKVGKRELKLLPVDQSATATEYTEYTATFDFDPEDIDANGNLAITFNSNGAIVPAALLNSADTRPLALIVTSVTIEEEVIDSPSDSLPSFPEGVLGLTDDRFSGGWLDIEPDGRWSDGNPSSLLIDLPDGVDSTVARFELVAFHGIASDEPVEIAINIDGAESCFALGVTSKICELEVYRQGNREQFEAILSCNHAVRPSDVDGSPDQRNLSFKLVGWSLASVPEMTDPANVDENGKFDLRPSESAESVADSLDTKFS